MSSKFDYIVFIGRFQISHNGHINTIKNALQLSKKVIVVLGSSNLPRTVKNPFTAEERMNMIRMSLTAEESSRVLFTHTNDYIYNNQKWVTEVQLRVSALIMDKNPVVGLIGLKKDESSFYLDLFPQWEYIPQAEKMVSSTQIREKFFECSMRLFPYESDVPYPVIRWLFNVFMRTPHFTKLKEEYEFLKKYKAQWAVAPYPVIFTTVDAVVIQSGHVLLIRRKACPGEGLLAIPGGFLNPNETIVKAMLRELKEETNINVPPAILEGHIKAQGVFDHPQRSQRGRTITHAFLIELPAGPLAKVKGGDDASKAMWVPLIDLEKKADSFFEDHRDIIENLLGKI